MKVLLITNHYLDRKEGGPNASKGFIKLFSSVFSDITLIYPDNQKGHIDHYIPDNVQKIPYHDIRTKLNKLVDTYRGRLHGLYSIVKKQLDNNRYDLIIIDHSVIWASLTEILKGTESILITIHHNVEKYYHRDNPANLLYRIPLRLFALKAESQAVRNSHINLTLTKKDVEEFKKLFPNAKGTFYHLGAFDYQTIEFKASQKNDLSTYIITGALSFPQSNYPIIEFLNKYYPIICKYNPQNTLIIAGREPTEEMERACKQYSSVHLIKNPPEMLPLLQKAGYYICPINMGSGQKTRVADGFKSGLPVLCHDISSYGYEEMTNRGFLFTYHDKESFEKAYVKMVSNHYSQLEVYNAYEYYFGVNAGVKRLIEILKKENIL